MNSQQKKGYQFYFKKNETNLSNGQRVMTDSRRVSLPQQSLSPSFIRQNYISFSDYKNQKMTVPSESGKLQRSQNYAKNGSPYFQGNSSFSHKTKSYLYSSAYQPLINANSFDPRVKDNNRDVSFSSERSMIKKSEMTSPLESKEKNQQNEGNQGNQGNQIQRRRMASLEEKTQGEIEKKREQGSSLKEFKSSFQKDSNQHQLKEETLFIYSKDEGFLKIEKIESKDYIEEENSITESLNHSATCMSCEQKTKHINNIERELQQSKEKSDKFLEQILRQQKFIKELQYAEIKYKVEVQAKDGEIGKLTSSRKIIEVEKKAIESACLKLRNDFEKDFSESMKAAKDDLNCQVQKMEEKKDGYLKQILKLQDQNMQLENQSRDLEAKREESFKQNQNQENLIMALKSNLKEFAQKCHKLVQVQSWLQESKQNKTKLQKELKSYKLYSEKLKRQSVQNNNKLIQSEANVKEITHDLDALKHKNELMRQQNDTMKEENHSLNTQISNLKYRLQEMQAQTVIQKTQWNHDYEGLKKRADHLQQLEKRLETYSDGKVYRKLIESIQSSDEIDFGFEKEREELLAEELEGLKKINCELSTRLDELEGLKKINCELSTRLDELEGLKKINCELSTRLDELEGLKKINCELSTRLDELEGLKKINCELSTRLDELEDSKQLSGIEMEKLKESQSFLADEMKLHQSQIKQNLNLLELSSSELLKAKQTNLAQAEEISRLEGLIKESEKAVQIAQPVDSTELSQEQSKFQVQEENSVQSYKQEKSEEVSQKDVILRYVSIVERMEEGLQDKQTAIKELEEQLQDTLYISCQLKDELKYAKSQIGEGQIKEKVSGNRENQKLQSLSPSSFSESKHQMNETEIGISSSYFFKVEEYYNEILEVFGKDLVSHRMVLADLSPSEMMEKSVTRKASQALHLDPLQRDEKGEDLDSQCSEKLEEDQADMYRETNINEMKQSFTEMNFEEVGPLTPTQNKKHIDPSSNEPQEGNQEILINSAKQKNATEEGRERQSWSQGHFPNPSTIKSLKIKGFRSSEQIKEGDNRKDLQGDAESSLRPVSTMVMNRLQETFSYMSQNQFEVLKVISQWIQKMQKQSQNLRILKEKQTAHKSQISSLKEELQMVSVEKLEIIQNYDPFIFKLQAEIQSQECKIIELNNKLYDSQSYNHQLEKTLSEVNLESIKLGIFVINISKRENIHDYNYIIEKKKSKGIPSGISASKSTCQQNSEITQYSINSSLATEKAGGDSGSEGGQSSCYIEQFYRRHEKYDNYLSSSRYKKDEEQETARKNSIAKAQAMSESLRIQDSEKMNVEELSENSQKADLIESEEEEAEIDEIGDEQTQDKQLSQEVEEEV